MTEARWHADDQLLRRYVGGQLDGVLAASVEQHLIRCVRCRAAIAAHVDRPMLDAVWSAIRATAQAPAPGVAERVLRRLGLSDSDALLLSTAPSLQASWLVGLVAALGFAAAAVGFGGTAGVGVFLLVAPLAPVAGIAVAYGPDADPSYEVTAAAPYSGVRLVLLRAAAVLVTALPLALVGGLLLPAPSWAAVAWLVPALAFTTVVLAGSTWTSPSRAGAAVAVCWSVVVAAVVLGDVPLVLIDPTALVLYLALGSVCALLFVRRIRRLTLLGRYS
jgi:hypothetical protein